MVCVACISLGAKCYDTHKENVPGKCTVTYAANVSTHDRSVWETSVPFQSLSLFQMGSSPTIPSSRGLGSLEMVSRVGSLTTGMRLFLWKKTWKGWG